MIHGEQEYQEYKDATRQSQQDWEFLDKQRKMFAEMDFSEDETDTLMEPLLTFYAQLSDEITCYENEGRDKIMPSKRSDAE